ncbi:hypothetical protein VPHD518_0066 [Vibrio phage D518]
MMKLRPQYSRLGYVDNALTDGVANDITLSLTIGLTHLNK